MNIQCAKTKEPAIRFGDLKDKEFFFSNGVLYIKIFKQDLAEYHISCVNAISIINAGLTKFDDEELVFRAEKRIDKNNPQTYYLVQAYKVTEDSQYHTDVYPAYLTSYDMTLGGNNFGLQSGIYDAIKFTSEEKAKEWLNYAASVFSGRTWEIVPVDARIFGKKTPNYIFV